MLNAQDQQFTMALNELDAQIKQLSSQPQTQPQTQPKAKTKADDLSKSETQKFSSASADQRETYVKALGELRKQVDLANEKYAALAEDADVKTALETLSKRSAKIKYLLGPSKKFLDTVKALEQAEARVASDTIIEQPRAAESAKRKSKMAKKR